MNCAHEKLVERMNFVSKFRAQHEQLLQTITNVSKQKNHGSLKDNTGSAFSDSSAIDEINGAYEIVKSIDVLDVSPSGTEEWIAVETNYNDRISKVEGQIITVLRNKLAQCKNANEMFRVFSSFNSLFIRPKVLERVRCLVCI